MLQTKQTQTHANQTAEPDAPARSTARVKVHTGARFDSSKAANRQKLMEWCRSQWKKTFKPSRDCNNMLYYHFCCGCFSKRRFLQQAGHPTEQTISVMRQVAFSDVDSPEKLYAFVLQLIAEASDRGMKTSFPSINCYHLDQTTADEQKPADEAQLLGKRLQEVVDQLECCKTKCQQLERHNTHLLQSSWHWYTRYQELFDRQDNAELDLLQTPVKQKPNFNFECSSDFNYSSSRRPSASGWAWCSTAATCSLSEMSNRLSLPAAHPVC